MSKSSKALSSLRVLRPAKVVTGIYLCPKKCIRPSTSCYTTFRIWRTVNNNIHNWSLDSLSIALWDQMSEFFSAEECPDWRSLSIVITYVSRSVLTISKTTHNTQNTQFTSMQGVCLLLNVVCTVCLFYWIWQWRTVWEMTFAYKRLTLANSGH